jgi:hypothetical protein
MPGEETGFRIRDSGFGIRDSAFGIRHSGAGEPAWLGLAVERAEVFFRNP